jgi:hypothetical protein
MWWAAAHHPQPLRSSAELTHSTYPLRAGPKWIEGPITLPEEGSRRKMKDKNIYRRMSGHRRSAGPWYSLDTYPLMLSNFDPVTSASLHNILRLRFLGSVSI